MLYNDDTWPQTLTNYFGNPYTNYVMTCKSSHHNNNLEVFSTLGNEYWEKLDDYEYNFLKEEARR